MTPAADVAGWPSPEYDAGAADPALAARRRAARLVRWYPRPWRERYGAEFTELLLSDIAERPHSLARGFDVARGGLLARLAGAGLAGSPLAVRSGDLAGARARQAAASLGTLCAASAVFLIVGAAQWSQLLIGWVWAARRNQQQGNVAHLAAADRNAALGASAAIIVLLALGVLAALPVLATVAARLAAPGWSAVRRVRLAVPVVSLIAALTGLVIGGRSLENNWIGTGGLHSPVPGGLAAFIWAVTLFVSAYWVHPGMLAAFPGAERTWMELSPLLLAVAVASAVILVRRAGVSPRVARFEARIALACCTVMTAFLGLCAAWLAADGPLADGTALFHAGWINVAGTAVLALAAAAAVAAARTARRTLNTPPPP
jgi:hypothetical protein